MTIVIDIILLQIRRYLTNIKFHTEFQCAADMQNVLSMKKGLIYKTCRLSQNYKINDK